MAKKFLIGNFGRQSVNFISITSNPKHSLAYVAKKEIPKVRKNRSFLVFNK